MNARRHKSLTGNPYMSRRTFGDGVIDYLPTGSIASASYYNPARTKYPRIFSSAGMRWIQFVPSDRAWHAGDPAGKERSLHNFPWLNGRQRCAVYRCAIQHDVRHSVYATTTRSDIAGHRDRPRPQNRPGPCNWQRYAGINQATYSVQRACLNRP